MRKVYVFRVYSPPDTVVVPVEHDRFMLPGVIEEKARLFAISQYVKKHKAPSADLVKIVEEPLVKPVKSNGS